MTMHLRVPRRRTIALVAGVSILGSVGLLVAEAVLGFSGAGSAQPSRSSDGTIGTGTGSPVRLVVLGDSTGVAVGAGDVALGYPRRLATALAAATGHRIDLHVLAVSGARIADVRTAQVPQLAPLRPDVILLVVGGNDVIHFTNQDDARRDLRFVIDAAKATGAGLVVSGIPAMGTIRRVAQPLRAIVGRVASGYEAVWEAEAQTAQVAFVDLAAQTEKPFSDDASMLSEDGFHPSAKGYELWAKAFEADVRRAIQRTLRRS